MALVVVIAGLVAILIQVRSKNKNLLWVSFGAAVIAGMAFVNTAAGSGMSSWFGGAIAGVTLTGMVVVLVVDLLDKKPNLPAALAAFITPSLILAVGGIQSAANAVGSQIGHVFDGAARLLGG